MFSFFFPFYFVLYFAGVIDLLKTSQSTVKTSHNNAAHVAQQQQKFVKRLRPSKKSQKRMFSDQCFRINDPHAGRQFLSLVLAASVLLSAAAIPIPSVHTRHGNGARYVPRGDFAPSEPIDCKVVHRVLQQAPRAHNCSARCHINGIIYNYPKNE